MPLEKYASSLLPTEWGEFTFTVFQDEHSKEHVAIDMIKQLEIRSVKVMTNNPLKIEALQAGGVDVLERVPVEVGVNQVNAQYLETKRDRMGHMLSLFNES